jgi:hypothetical protein
MPEMEGFLKDAITGHSPHSYPLKELLNDFVERNSLPEVISEIKIPGGYFVRLRDDSMFLLSSELLETGNRLEPFFGKTQGYRYSSIKTRYRAVGDCPSGNTIDLEVERDIITTFKMRKQGPREFVPQPYQAGEPSVSVYRKDNYPLWFVVEPRTLTLG